MCFSFQDRMSLSRFLPASTSDHRPRSPFRFPDCAPLHPRTPSEGQAECGVLVALAPRHGRKTPDARATDIESVSYVGQILRWLLVSATMNICYHPLAVDAKAPAVHVVFIAYLRTVINLSQAYRLSYADAERRTMISHMPGPQPLPLVCFTV